MEKTRLGKGEHALRKLISPSNGSTSIIGNAILVDRQIHAVGFQYKHALMITKNTETYDETGELYRKELEIVHYSMKGALGILEEYVDFSKVPSFGIVKKDRLVIYRKRLENGGETYFFKETEDSTKLLQACFDGKLSLLTHPNFPHSESERNAAAQRAYAHIGEQAYSAEGRNCQHLITNILLGKATSHDAEKNKSIACIIDSLTQSFGRGFHFLLPLLKKLSVVVLNELNEICLSGVLNTLLSSGGDDVAEILGNLLNLLAVPDLTPLETILKNAKFALLIEFLVFTLQTVRDLWQLYKGTKKSTEVAPMLIKRFFAALGGAGGAAAGSALAVLVLGCGPGGVLLSQVLAALVFHALGMRFGSWLCGGKGEQYIVSILDRLVRFAHKTRQITEGVLTKNVLPALFPNIHACVHLYRALKGEMRAQGLLP